MGFRWLFTWQLCLQKRYLNGGLWSWSGPWVNFVWMPNQDPRNLLSPEAVHETTCLSARGVSGVAGACHSQPRAWRRGQRMAFISNSWGLRFSSLPPSLHHEECRVFFFKKTKSSRSGKMMPGAGHWGKTAECCSCGERAFSAGSVVKVRVGCGHHGLETNPLAPASDCSLLAQMACSVHAFLDMQISVYLW